MTGTPCDRELGVGGSGNRMLRLYAPPGTCTKSNDYHDDPG